MRKLVYIFLPLWIGIALPVSGQSSEIPSLDYEPVIGFLNLPDGMHFEEVAAIDLNSKGHIFVFHRGKDPLLEFNGDGDFVRSIGADLFPNAHGMRIDSEDNIWTTDLSTHLVIKMNPNGRILLVLGKKGVSGEWYEEILAKLGAKEWSDSSTMPLFDKPSDIAFGSNGDIFISDGYGNSRVMKFDKDGKFLKSWGAMGEGLGYFKLPHGIAVDAKDRVYVADRENKRIQVFDSEGEFLTEWTNVGYPYGLFITQDQYLYMTDARAERVLKLNLKGEILGSLGEPGKSIGQFGWAHGICVGSNEEIYVTEILNWRIQKFEKK